MLQVPIPDHLDLYHLSEEVAPTDRTALETVTGPSFDFLGVVASEKLIAVAAGTWTKAV
jgi:hypothetical protein